MDIRRRIGRILDNRAEETRKGVIKVVLVSLVIIAGIWLGLVATRSEVIQDVVGRYHYFGVFLAAIVSGFNLVVPVPAVAFVPLFLASGLEIGPIILVLSLGMTVADTLAFLLGKAGRTIPSVRETRLVRRLERIRDRHYWHPLVFMFVYACVAPFPNEVVAVPLGAMGYPIAAIVPPLLMGNLVFNAIGAWGIATVFSSL
jgi:membrane protein YqaA with SNARE-associated domain